MSFKEVYLKVPDGRLLNAKLSVGAKTVKGPGPDNVPSRAHKSIAVVRVE